MTKSRSWHDPEFEQELLHTAAERLGLADVPATIEELLTIVEQQGGASELPMILTPDELAKAIRINHRKKRSM